MFNAHRILAKCGDFREIPFPFHRISDVVQHFNAVLLHNSFTKDEQPLKSAISICFYFVIF